MDRFVALLWNFHDPALQTEVAAWHNRVRERLPKLSRVFNGRGLTVFQDQSESLELRGDTVSCNQGVIVGSLFKREDARPSHGRVTSLDAVTVSRLATSQGRSLIRDYWGSYVALVQKPQAEGAIVLRGPCAEIPCYWITIDRIQIVFSDLDDLQRLKPLRLTLNWPYVVARLLSQRIQPDETGFKEISAVRAGECLEFDKGTLRSRSYSWDLAAIAASAPIESIDDAERSARTIIVNCVGAKASLYDRIVHLLSGGVDSSVVLVCLALAHEAAAFDCANYHDRSAGNDERSFARLGIASIAQTCGRRVPLKEYERDARFSQLRRALDTVRAPSPVVSLRLLIGRHFDEIATQGTCRVLFTGQAGDAVFYHSTGADTALDYLFRNGYTKELLSVALDATAHSDETFWRVLWDTVRRGRRRGRKGHYRSPFIDKGVFLTPESLELVKPGNHYFVPPWLASAPTDVLKALSNEKLRHIETMCTHLWSLRDPLDRVGGLRWLAPLAEQPVIELFARIPLHILHHGGVDRAVARRAFETELGPALLGRHTKSLQNHFFTSAVHQEMAFFREVLLDGQLVKEKILRREAVERVVNGVYNERSALFLDLAMTHFDVEVWLRTCEPLIGAQQACAA